MRPRSTESSSARMWRHFELTCALSCPTRRPSSAISSPYRTSSPNCSQSSSHRRRLRHDSADHQGSSYTLSRSFIAIGDNVHTCFKGCGCLGLVMLVVLVCVCFMFELYFCFSDLVCSRVYLVICVFFRVCVRFFFFFMFVCARCHEC